MEIIKIENLCKKFGEVMVLDNLSLSFEQGQIYGLVGENGAGKTTLFNCMMDLMDYKGNIERNAGLKIGFMPADSFFYPMISAYEHIEFCLKAKGVIVNRDEIDELNRLFELPLSRYASKYSTGMKKKLAFMTILLQKNDLIILDEPFNGVDLRGGINMRRIIKAEKEKGRTFIISSHQIASLREICDSIDFLTNHHIFKRYTEESVETIEEEILMAMSK